MLPHLEELKLKCCRAKDDVWRLSDKDIFRSLKLLLLSELNLKGWEASSDNFPNLKRLVLKKCKDLQKIPTDFVEICTLESIELHDCTTTAEDSVRNIEQEREDMGYNIVKVYIHNSHTYTAVISLLQTLDQPNISELFHDHSTEMLDSLRATAEYFQHVLENTSNEKIKSFEEDIRVVVSEAEDVVEMKISEIIKEESWTFGILQHQDMLPVVEKMDTTKKQVMEILSHDADQILELTADSLIGASSMSDPMLSDQLKDDIVKGLDGDLEIIDKRLRGPMSYLDIVTISGITLTIFVWVTISQEFRYRNVLLEALHCISKKSPKDYDEMNDSELAHLVRKSLKGPRYLVVVDDIWSRDAWESISQIFPNRNNGSRVLLTTRETDVAILANISSHHKMNFLDLDNSWKLLRDKVFGLEHDHPPELERN
uniref:NBS-coding resistance gene analog n=1 Tax=Solanum tuberosum TaxID=4113 RepID=M1BAT6_SOLTU